MYHDPRTPPNSYTRLNPTMNFVERNGKLSQEHQISHGDWHGEVQFRPIQEGVMITPPSPARSPSRPLLGHRPFSPETRAQAIARGRSELMEMVRHMPESNYELSLKDIVEHHHKSEDDHEQKRVVKVKKEEGKRVERNLSFENKGLFLNMVFPFSLRSRRKKKSGGGGRVSPVKVAGERVAGERDWWKKKLRGSSDSDSSRTSDNSGASSSTVSSGGATVSSGGGDEHGRRRDGFTRGCFHFFNSRRRCKFAE